MKTPVDTPDPDPRVTREESLEERVDIEPEDSRQEPHLSAAHQDGLKDGPT
ncbi:hypothetical protein N5J43_10985 [Pseudomonas nicosulfuronedens]|uniref:hypothetical protein n=1 Tax=Pseudomonas nicosulfuronedens TaxID=2571105 RepID=UPI00148724C1|nr:hypothetical protein [Pseudomonas nicosulfuronedens]MDH1010955.1 hypothetical protein [Pseudomonas nicosulfuronedens]MDH1979478.1 hypothetical protein [Pseudomonas nicosulfuronedens]MDH2026725.1 hypothetical protein [Pseudomonas nicosulfuronedens]